MIMLANTRSRFWLWTAPCMPMMATHSEMTPKMALVKRSGMPRFKRNPSNAPNDDVTALTMTANMYFPPDK